jgi:hypothetical protein
MKLIGTNFWRGTFFSRWQKLLVIGVATTALVACGGGGSAAPAPVTYTIGGTLSGLTGTLVLQNNGGDDLSLSADGSFSFSKTLSSGATYTVTVLTQPSGEICTVSSGSGTVTANVSTVAIQCIPWTGTKQLGVAGSFTSGHSIATDASANVYVAGWTYGGLDGNTLTGASDVFVTKYNSSGIKQFTRQLGVAGAYTLGSSVAIDVNGNVYVAGTTYGGLDGNMLTGVFSDFFLTKFNSSGVKQYTRQLGVAEKATYGASVSTDVSGNVYVAGTTYGGLDGNTLTGLSDFFVTKYNSNGIKQFTRQLGVAGAYTLGSSIATDMSGNVFVTGDTTGGLDGNTLTGITDSFVTKYDSSGVKQYTQQLGVTGTETHSNAVATDASANVYVTGWTGDGQNVTTLTGTTSDGLGGNTQTGTMDSFVAKYNSSGVRQYTRQLGVAGTATESYSVATDTSGNVYVAGWTWGGLDGNTLTGITDSFVTKYDSSGVKQYTQQLGATGAMTSGYSVATDGKGNAYVAGTTFGNLDGNTRMGPSDFFVTKYNSDGVKQ